MSYTSSLSRHCHRHRHHQQQHINKLPTTGESTRNQNSHQVLPLLKAHVLSKPSVSLAAGSEWCRWASASRFCATQDSKVSLFKTIMVKVFSGAREPAGLSWAVLLHMVLAEATHAATSSWRLTLGLARPRACPAHAWQLSRGFGSLLCSLWFSGAISPLHILSRRITSLCWIWIPGKQKWKL